MSAAGHQMLRVLDGSYVLDRPTDVPDANPGADVLAVVFGPDGSTVMRRDDSGEETWSALWNQGSVTSEVCPVLGVGGVAAGWWRV